MRGALRQGVCGPFKAPGSPGINAGFSKRIEVGVSIYKVGGELRTEEGSSGRRGVLEILDCRRCISEHILPLDSPKNFGSLKGIFFCKMYYNVVSVAAGEKQGYTKQFSRQLS